MITKYRKLHLFSKCFLYDRSCRTEFDIHLFLAYSYIFTLSLKVVDVNEMNAFIVYRFLYYE
jgi:hypothetical protein